MRAPTPTETRVMRTAPLSPVKLGVPRPRAAAASRRLVLRSPSPLARGPLPTEALAAGHTNSHPDGGGRHTLPLTSTKSTRRGRGEVVPAALPSGSSGKDNSAGSIIARPASPGVSRRRARSRPSASPAGRSASSQHSSREVGGQNTTGRHGALPWLPPRTRKRRASRSREGLRPGAYPRDDGQDYTKPPVNRAKFSIYTLGPAFVMFSAAQTFLPLSTDFFSAITRGSSSIGLTFCAWGIAYAVQQVRGALDDMRARSEWELREGKRKARARYVAREYESAKLSDASDVQDVAGGPRAKGDVPDTSTVSLRSELSLKNVSVIEDEALMLAIVEGIASGEDTCDDSTIIVTAGPSKYADDDDDAVSTLRVPVSVGAPYDDSYDDVAAMEAAAAQAEAEAAQFEAEADAAAAEAASLELVIRKTQARMWIVRWKTATLARLERAAAAKPSAATAEDVVPPSDDDEPDEEEADPAVAGPSDLADRKARAASWIAKWRARAGGDDDPGAPGRAGRAANAEKWVSKWGSKNGLAAGAPAVKPEAVAEAAESGPNDEEEREAKASSPGASAYWAGVESKQDAPRKGDDSKEESAPKEETAAPKEETTPKEKIAATKASVLNISVPEATKMAVKEASKEKEEIARTVKLAAQDKVNPAEGATIKVESVIDEHDDPLAPGRVVMLAGIRMVAAVLAAVSVVVLFIAAPEVAVARYPWLAGLVGAPWAQAVRGVPWMTGAARYGMLFAFGVLVASF